ncbi:MAG: hypothetical protein DRN12_03245, partial [Thermoplasmata archaeon]
TGGEGVILYFKAPGDTEWQVFSVNNLNGKATLYSYRSGGTYVEVEEIFGSNLVPNSSFDSGSPCPTNWTCQNTTYTYTTTATSHTGTQSMRLDNTGSAAYYFYSDTFSVSPGYYKISYWARKDPSATGGFIISDFIVDSGPGNRDSEAGRATTSRLTEHWSKYEYLVRAYQSANAYIRFYTYHITGSIYIDDVRVERVSPTYNYVNGAYLDWAERIVDGNYTYQSAMYKHNSADRVIETAQWMHASRFSYGLGSYVKWRFDPGNFEQTAGTFFIRNNYNPSGAVGVVEVSADDSSWTQIGSFNAVGNYVFPIPSSFYPTTGPIYIKVTYSSGSGGFQIQNIRYTASLTGSPGDYYGFTKVSDLTMNGKSVSIEAWVKANSCESGYIAGKGERDWNPEYQLYCSDGNVHFRVGAHDLSKASTGAPLSLNTWHYIVGTYDGINLKLYIDGSLANSTTSTGGLTSTMASFFIGSSEGGAEPFDGLIDEVAVHARVLSSEEILNRYNVRKALFSDWNVGKSDRALQFDGSTYVEVSEDSSLDLSDKFTWSAWVYWEGAKGNSDRQIIWNKEEQYEWGITDTASPSGRISWAIRTAGTWEWHDTGVSVTPNEWTHVVLVYDGTNVTSYKNGSYVDSIADPDGGAISNYDNALRIGARGAPNTAGSFFYGTIDEIAIYSTALSADEIAKLYALGKAKHLNWTAGKSGPGLKFDGNSIYVDVADNPSLDIARKLSVAFWIKPFSFVRTWHPLIYKGDGTGSNGRSYSAWLNESGYIHFTSSDGTQEFLNTPNGSIPLNQWTHFVGVIDRDAGTIEAYVNGSKIASGSIRTNNIIDTNHTLRIGWTHESSANYAPFHGLMDELAIYSKTLSADEVAELYAAGRARHSDFNAGISGKAIQFDGVDDYVEVADSSTLRLKAPFTVEAWVYINSAPSDWVRIVGKGDFTYRNYGLWYNGSLSQFLFQIYSAGGSGNLSYYTNISTNKWYHIAGTYDGFTMKLYVDGNEVSAAYSQTPYTHPDPLTIGYAGFHACHNGLIDDVRIYNYAKSAQEIEADYNAGVQEHNAHIQTDENGLVALWHLDGYAEQTTALDSAGSNNGTLNGFDFWDLNSGWVEGKFGRALRFDGNDDYVSVPDSQSLDINKESTIEAWIKPLGESADWAKIIVKPDDSGYYSYGLSLNDASVGNERISFIVGNGTTYGGTAYSDTIISPGKWYHVVGIFDNGTTYLYINGTLEKTNEESFSALSVSNADLEIGSQHANSQGFNGIIDEVAIYNRALSEREIKDHYEAFVNKGMIYSPGSIKSCGVG